MTPTQLVDYHPDVLVVGAGNAAFCAGLAAAEHDVSVLMLERSPVRREMPPWNVKVRSPIVQATRFFA